jgi:hypothetical protein
MHMAQCRGCRKNIRFADDSLSKLLTLRLANRVVGLILSGGRAVVVRSEPKPLLGRLHSYLRILKPKTNDGEIEACSVPPPNGVFKTAWSYTASFPHALVIF